MKTLAQSISVSVAIYTVLFLLLASIAYGTEVNYDPPSINKEASLQEVTFEEEEYIDDIPFNTMEIAENYHLNQSMNVEFDFEEEAYIDDISFDTYKIAENYKIEESLKNVFNMEEETYVDDIPFDTERIASEVFFIYYSK